MVWFFDIMYNKFDVVKMWIRENHTYKQITNSVIIH
jgi:hypothetical protein